MDPYVVLLSVPGLRSSDLSAMPRLSALMRSGQQVPLIPGFPAVTWPVQANMLTGKSPREHGVVANGFYWRDEHRVEMWTAGNQCIQAPQIWDILHDHDPSIQSAAWFPMLSKGSGADVICMPAPVHNPDGSETMWCYSQPEGLYGQLREALGDFPLQHFWGPMANVTSSQWIANSALFAAEQYPAHFWYIYLPHLDYAAQRSGPDSPAATKAAAELDDVIGQLAEGLAARLPTENLLLLVASEYVVTAVDHVVYPNRLLREAGYLVVRETEDGEELDFKRSLAWTLVDHQCGHVFLQQMSDAPAVADLFRNEPGIAEVLTASRRARYQLDHPRSGDIVLVSEPRSWQAYYWWFDDDKAPPYARTVDIHRKPGYDPLELIWDRDAGGVPLDPMRIGGSHGAPATSVDQRGVFLSSEPDLLPKRPMADRDVAAIVLSRFGVSPSAT